MDLRKIEDTYDLKAASEPLHSLQRKQHLLSCGQRLRSNTMSRTGRLQGLHTCS